MAKIKKPKTIGKLHKELWKLVSEYNRRKFADRNGYVACCSCGVIHHWSEMDCGHYISKGGHRAVMYDPINLHAQCKGCNAFRQGNAIGYRAFLVQKYGEADIKLLEARRKFPAGYTREGLQLRIDEYKQKLKELDKV